ncbi:MULTISPECIES: hypothetical protein [Calothrix]|uniref:Uncharacterized protein n=2 Tax=Calothrix TaxID=1186 RepID=A0ABR8A9F9_9CYAN|nr:MULTISPECIES: hypothetical protein [Calothrix]MBD2196626.1 hypothetical protein [Calothrix parietina FACHB-288]MBD2228009.1 hypothetical protein [Calothrix anomala FACHB-343]
MANIIVKDAFNKNVYLKASGTGTIDDPYVTQQDNTIINTSLPLPLNAATESTASDIRSFNEMSLGQRGHTLVTSTLPQSGSWVAIQIIEAASFVAMTCANTSTPAVGVELPTGFILYGNISAFTLEYGKVIAYKR